MFTSQRLSTKPLLVFFLVTIIVKDKPCFKWNDVKIRSSSYERNLSDGKRKTWKRNSGCNGIRFREPAAIPMQCCNQLNYEATSSFSWHLKIILSFISFRTKRSWYTNLGKFLNFVYMKEIKSSSFKVQKKSKVG